MRSRSATRVRSGEPATLEPALAAEPPEPDPMLRAAIDDCRDRLPPKPRQAFDARLASAGGHDDVELATSLGLKVNTFLQNFTRARQLLVDCLNKKGVAL